MLCKCQGWRLHLLLLLAGGAVGWFNAPYNFWWLSLLSFPILFLAVHEAASAKLAFVRGWVFGFGYFIFGLYWIAAALFVDIAQFWWALPLAVAALPMGLALFWGATAALTHKYGGRGLGQLLMFVGALLLAEWLRGHILTGFPWLLLGYMWVDVAPVRALAATGGIYGLTLWALLLATLPALLFMTASRREKVIGLMVGAFLLVLPLLNPAAPVLAAAGSVRVRLVQPNIAQTMKMDPAAREQTMATLLALTSQPGNPQVVVWPETAVPFLLAERADVRARIAASMPAGSMLITGAVRRDQAGFYNSVLAMTELAEVIGSYDKSHLVPFGEYIPLRQYLPFDPVAGGMNFSAGPGPQTLVINGLPSFGPLVCYEVIFPLHVVNETAPPQWLVNVTNDGWYGVTHGPYQHFEIARLRAIEEGMPLVRAANTGISGVVDANGNVLARTTLATAAIEDVTLNIVTIATIYRNYGDWPVLFMAILLVFLPILTRHALAQTSLRF